MYLKPFTAVFFYHPKKFWKISEIYLFKLQILIFDICEFYNKKVL